MPKTLSIIIAEDDDDQRNGIRDFFTFGKHRVVAVATGRDFYQALDGSNFDVAIIDIGLPDQSGLVLAEYLRANSNTGIIILTGREDEEHQLKGYESGADIYLTKPVPSRVLSAAVTRLAERLNIRPSQNTDSPPAWTLNRITWCVSNPNNKTCRITALEFKFLELLATSQQQMSNREYLQSKIYPNADTQSSRALDALVQRLRAKLFPASKSETDCPLKSVYGYGYRLSEPFKIIN